MTGKRPATTALWTVGKLSTQMLLSCRQAASASHDDRRLTGASAGAYVLRLKRDNKCGIAWNICCGNCCAAWLPSRANKTNSS